MPKFTLQDIRDAADKKYGPYVIDGIQGGDVTLVNPLRLPKSKRDKMAALDDGDEADVEDKLHAIVKLAASPADAKRLLDEVGGDLAVLSEILSGYMNASQVGEASTSAS